MSKMARPSLKPCSVQIPLVLCLMIALLGLHFLLEDNRLSITAFPSAVETSPTGDEIDHQDDLALPVKSIGQAALRAIPADFCECVCLQPQFCSPTLPPPKNI